MSEACYPVLDAVVESIADEYARLQERIKDWKTLVNIPRGRGARLCAPTTDVEQKHEFCCKILFPLPPLLF
ncbi:MAG: hypothetical protein V7L20_18605 [Nostoc sp.]